MQSPPASPRGELLQQYVRARIVDMSGIDIGLFDFDRNNALYYFVLNADETIYLRYGGRDADAADKYLDHDSLLLALQRGLELHAEYTDGKLPAQPRPAAFFPDAIPLLKTNEIDRGRCVECHLIGDYQLQERERDGSLDKLREMYRYPDINRIGIYLDIPKGLVVEKAEGPAAEAGMLPGDTIAALDGTPVYTFGDLQYRYDKVPKEAKRIVITVERAETTEDLAIELPEEWWWTDLYYRFLTIDPEYYFFADALPDEVKEALGLPLNGFAARITEVDPAAKVFNSHKLERGDIVTAVEGVQSDPFTRNLEVYIKLHVRAGDTVALTVLRDGAQIEMPLTTHRQFFRKAETKDK